MNQSPKPSMELATLAIAITLAIVIAGNAATAVMLGEPIVADGSFGFIDAVDVAVLHFIFTGIPFFALAAKGDRRKPMLAVATALTTASWAYSSWQIWRDSLTGFAGGANIGLGLIMMAAPFAILVVLKAQSLTLRALARRKQ